MDAKCYDVCVARAYGRRRFCSHKLVKHQSALLPSRKVRMIISTNHLIHTSCWHASVQYYAALVQANAPQGAYVVVGGDQVGAGDAGVGGVQSQTGLTDSTGTRQGDTATLQVSDQPGQVSQLLLPAGEQPTILEVELLAKRRTEDLRGIAGFALPCGRRAPTNQSPPRGGRASLLYRRGRRGLER